MQALIIVESPNKTKKIESFLGAGFKCMASVGHIRDLPESADGDSIGVAPPDFKPQYVLTERGRGTVAKLKAAVAQSDVVFLATDADREGEAIAWHLQQALGLKGAQRITFQEITEKAVKAALHAPRAIDTKLVVAQETRRVLDRLVGYMVSPALCKQSGQRLSAGRVQSVALRIVADREAEIRSFKPTTHFGARVAFGDPTQKGTVWTADWNVKPLLKADEEYMLDSALAGRVAALRAFTVESCDTKETSKAPPAPFTTSTMQQAASVALGMNIDEAMAAAQKLFEQGAITYHRSDATNLADTALAELAGEAAKRGLTVVQPSRRWKSKDGAQEAHEAIRPTHFDVEEAGDSDAEKALYRLIWQRTMACQLEAARYSVRTAVLVAQLDGRRIEFIAKGRTLIYKGWRGFLADDVLDEDEQKDESASNPVPQLGKGSGQTAHSGKLLTQQTNAPKRYTQASLVAKLEAEGVGRPSTYAAIIKTNFTRGYFEEKKRQLYATELGEYVSNGLKGRFKFMDIPYTRELEATLDRIAQGQATYKTTIQAVHADLERELSTFTLKPLANYPCPECGKPMRRMKGATGFFWGCTGYNDGCKTTQMDVNGKPEAAPVCPTCKQGHLRKLNGPKGAFWGCDRYKEGCKATFENVRGKPSFAPAKKTTAKKAATKKFAAKKTGGKR
jgi:DNA topoisomerase-1